MDTELNLFLQEVLLQAGYTMADFVSTNFTYVNPALEAYYGLPASTGSNFHKVNLTNRPGGILFNGALLTRNAKFFETHPIQQGLVCTQPLAVPSIGYAAAQRRAGSTV